MGILLGGVGLSGGSSPISLSMIGGGFGFLVGLMMLTNMSIVNDAISEIEDIKSAKANLILA